MNTKPRYGANIDDWIALDAWHGLTADLLPVVANPKARISPESKMRDKGKVPSRYNRTGEVAGFPNWTQFKASPGDVERWAKNGDYGICIQTRNLRALDVDIPDPDVAARIEAFITERIGSLPMRTRNNSSKFLLAFKIEGDMPKRVIKVRDKVVDENGKTAEPAWVIEFLATGQQFVAAGTHTSGARIEWIGGLPDHFPVIELEAFNKLWKELEDTFAIEPSWMAGVRKRGESFKSDDDTAKMLIDKGLVLDYGNQGQLFVECPWKGEHSIDSGVTECAYFSRGSGGYDLGHFKCMHAGCATRSDTDFEEALGLRDDMFEALPAVATANGLEALSLPKFKRDGNGKIESSLHNLRRALERADICGLRIRYDVFMDDDTVAVAGMPWRAMTDADSVNIREHLECNGFKPIGKEMFRDAITAHGYANRFDSAVEWAENLPAWDGAPRVAGFLHKYFKADDAEYASAVSRYLWTALAGRCLVPGIKADMVVVLQGEQGIVKSSAIAALVPWEEVFCELNLADDEEKLARLMRGKLLAELGELRGLHSRELESIKAWIVRRFDEWVPKFKERKVTVKRRTVLVGTTNHVEFLVDETGHRRFLPLSVGVADIKGIIAAREQLWAEAIAIFKKSGIAWQDAERLAKAEHSKFVIHDAWEESVLSWLHLEDIDGTKPVDREWLRITDVLQGALNIDPKNSNMMAEKRAAKVLKSLGYARGNKTIDGKQRKVFVKS